MARFFIDRPVFAWVVSILIMLFGVLAITQLPIAQYPRVAPPSIAVTAIYAGASAVWSAFAVGESLIATAADGRPLIRAWML